MFGEAIRWKSDPTSGCCRTSTRGASKEPEQDVKAKTPLFPRGLYMVAPTGVDPVTFRFSVERSTN